MRRNANVLRCGFCGWTTLRYFHQDGALQQGYGRLERHVESQHRREYAPILHALMDEAVESERDEEPRYAP